MIASPSFDTRRALLLAIPALLAALSTGCVDTYPADLHYTQRTDPLVIDTFKNVAIPHFDPPGQMDFLFSLVRSEKGSDPDRALLIDPNKLSGNQRQKLSAALEADFGTPLNPKVPKLGDSEGAGDPKKDLKLDDTTLAEGSRLYRLHCLHCHGLSGNGRGPTASWINPHPRDFRSGIFKFTSSSQPDKVRKPRRDDLLRTLRQGIEGTAMPSFVLQPEKDLDAIASYVIHLSLRGQVEFEMIKGLLSKEAPIADDEVPDRAKELAVSWADLWQKAQTSLITPPVGELPTNQEESIRNGHKLFTSLGCLGCHKDFGRQNNFLPDSWGTIVRAADLTQGVYRGGRRPIDLYWRVNSGVNGANMPALPSAPPKDIWDVVNFLQVLPYPEMRKKYLPDVDFHQ